MLLVVGALCGGPSVRAEFHTIRFLNTPPVPTGHLPDTGGILIPTSHNFQEEGIHVEAIWAPSTHVGLTQGHFHHLEFGFETSHGFGNADAFGWHDLLGFYIKTLDGRPFSLRSIDYRLRVYLLNTDILVSTQLDATQPFGGQFVHYPVSKFSTFQTQNFTAHENVNQIFISSILAGPNTEQIQWDNIVIWTDPATLGACCPSTGISCDQQTAANCASSGGTYLGDNVPCSGGGTYCPTLAGACCSPDAATCAMTAPTGCLLPSGVFAGLGTECGALNACPLDTGRCCIDNGADCLQVLEASCTGPDTYFHGVGSDCNDPGDCLVPCDTDADCDDAEACNGAETCEIATGNCLAGTSLDCDDADACTSDTCDSVGGCEYTVLSCNDSDPCTVDSCDVELGCSNVAVVCTDGDACNGLETCDSETGLCQNGTEPDCDDNSVCTVDSCNPATGCEHVAPECDDGVACTLDSCDPIEGFCTHDPSDALCDNGIFCDGVETCDVLLGCQAGPTTDCDDAVDCTVDACNETTDQCDHTPDHVSCDNGIFCDGMEVCDLALDCQAGPAETCDDGVGCTVDTCIVATDACEHSPDDAACDNGLYCDGDETCDVLLGCQAGVSVDCDDDVACTVDSCNETLDVCDNTPNNAACDDGLFCNGMESCDPLLGCQAGSATDCDDAVDCTVDACNETTNQCDNTPDHVSCDNGIFCDGMEVCDLALDCQAGPAETCDDGIGCTVDLCNVTTDACEHSPDDAACDNGLYCDGDETCDALLGCQAGVSVDCDDDISCTVDSCNEALDACDNTPNNAACDDGLFCNGFETCSDIDGCLAGTDPCLIGELCDESTNQCNVASVSGTWMSFADSAAIPSLGIVENEDIVSYNAGTWSLIFDGSDVGLSAFTIDGLARLADGSILLSFAEPGSIAGMTGGPSGDILDDSDIVRFIPAFLGAATSGSFVFYFDGSDVGLTNDGEDIDAIIVTASGQLIVSTIGGVSVVGVSGVHADLLIFTPTTLGSVTAGTWAMYFDGSDVGFGSSGTEDVDAAAMSSTGALVVSTIGDFNVSGLAGPNEDAIKFNATALGDVTAGTFVPLLDLSVLGIDSSENLGGIEIVP